MYYVYYESAHNKTVGGGYGVLSGSSQLLRRRPWKEDWYLSLASLLTSSLRGAKKYDRATLAAASCPEAAPSCTVAAGQPAGQPAGLSNSMV